MVKFLLKTKGGEVINKVYANTIDDAENIFASVKQLPIDDLIRLFNIEVAV